MLLPCPEPYAHWQFTDPATGDVLRIVPERGGLVCGWLCHGPWGGREILYFDAERFADSRLSVRGGIPVLFPLCGNLPDDTLALPQGRFPIAQHGFARDLPWALEALDGEPGVRLSLQDGEATRPHYPFAFRLTLELRLEPGALAITAVVRHTGAPGTPVMPFAFGLHPYLAVPDLGQARLTGLPPHCLDQAAGGAAATAELLERLSGGVDLLAQPTAAVTLHPGGGAPRVVLEAEPPFDLAVVWTDPPRPMVCLEPWTAARGALAPGHPAAARKLVLEPGEERRLRCRYRVLPEAA
ncbi:MAG: galactose mutarotase [Synechococcus sp.]